MTTAIDTEKAFGNNPTAFTLKKNSKQINNKSYACQHKKSHMEQDNS